VRSVPPPPRDSNKIVTHLSQIGDNTFAFFTENDEKSGVGRLSTAINHKLVVVAQRDGTEYNLSPEVIAKIKGISIL
jgi:hypothetical protein